MEANLFKKFPFHHKGKMYEIKVFKDDNGCSVKAYLDDKPAFDHGYFCDYQADANYKKMFGQFGWQRLIFCAKADITGQQIYRVNKAS